MRGQELGVAQGVLPGRFDPLRHSRKPVTEAHVQEDRGIVKMTLAIELMKNIRVLDAALQIEDQLQACRRHHVCDRIPGYLLMNRLAGMSNVCHRHEAGRKIDLEGANRRGGGQPDEDRYGEG